MARKIQDTVIDGITYSVTTVGAKKGSKVLARLFKVLGPILALNGKVTEDNILQKGGEALGEVLRDLREEDLDFFVDTFAGHTEVVLAADKRPQLSLILDDHFDGRYEELFAWLKFCVQLNFPSFFKLGTPKVDTPAA